MTLPSVNIEAIPLKLKLKTTIRHDSATRNEGKSVWVCADRNGYSGYGEGCPRVHVAGDELESSIRWIWKNFQTGRRVS
ncbi:MAG: hypothetical protein EHM85_07605 [Desulfobacteraceae bacterium]|nr:MAG: hypothetical protein EHM85_07605 [Desulfobacteraceae bacterium]